MRRSRSRWRALGLLTLLAMATVVASAGCGDEDPAAAPVAIAASYPLPFGLEQVEGTEPLGRPVVTHDPLLLYNGVEVLGVQLRAMYRVTDDDPIGALRSWVDQLAALRTVPELRAGQRSSGRSFEPWATVTGYASAPVWATVDASLWTTTVDDILLVNVSQADGVQSGGLATTVIDQLTESADRPNPYEVRSQRPGGELFTEQGFTIHLPAGTTSLMPTLPTRAGTGGSTSLLSSVDPQAALQAMLEEAMDGNDDGESTGIEAAEHDGMQILSVTSVIAAGGWGFSATSIRGPDDPAATIVITSNAD